VSDKKILGKEVVADVQFAKHSVKTSSSIFQALRVHMSAYMCHRSHVQHESDSPCTPVKAPYGRKTAKQGINYVDY
jgi:hypothetical protein